MKNLMKMAAAAILLISFAASAENRGARKVRDLLNGCRLAENALHDTRLSPNDTFRAGYCFGIAMGLLGGARMAEAAEQLGKPYPICVPEGVTSGDLVNVFIRWAEEHPEKWHRSEFAGLWWAIREVFPCD